MSNRVFESIVFLAIGSWRIRVWRTEAEIGVYDNADLVMWASGCNHHARETADTLNEHKVVLEAILQFPRVAAVEVIDNQGVGCLVYNDWP